MRFVRSVMNGVPHLPGRPNSVGISLSVGTADVNGPSGHRFEEKLRDLFSIGQSRFLYGRAVGYYALCREGPTQTARCATSSRSKRLGRGATLRGHNLQGWLSCEIDPRVHRESTGRKSCEQPCQ